jgi:hypothetical protein
MGRKPDPINELPFSNLWKEIRLYHSQQHWNARLRVAANLIGFWQFSVGWCWTEYKAITEDDRTHYENEAKQKARCGLSARLLDSSNNEAQKGSEARLNGRRHRRKQVEKTLQRLIEREEIKLYRRKLVFPEATHDPFLGPMIARQTDPYERLLLHISESSIGSPIWRRTFCEVDALNLLDWIVAQTETRGRRPIYNWLKVERWCRDEIETRGIPESAASLAGKAIDAYSSEFQKDTIPDTKHAEEIASRLLHEYATPK